MNHSTMNARSPAEGYALFVAREGNIKRFATLSCARLSEISPKFKACLNLNLKEGLDKRITVQIPRTISREFILFVKTGNILLKKSNILGLIRAADEHCMDELKEKCYAFIEDHFKILPKSHLRRLIRLAKLISDIRLFIIASMPKSSVHPCHYNPKMPVIRVYRPIEDIGDSFFKVIDSFGLPFELLVDNESIDDIACGQLRHLRGFGNNNHHYDPIQLAKSLERNSKHSVTTRSLTVICRNFDSQALLLSLLEPIFSHLYYIVLYQVNCTSLKLEQARKVRLSSCYNLTQVIAEQVKSVKFFQCERLKLVDIPKATSLHMEGSTAESIHAPNIREAEFLKSTVVEPLSLDSVESLLIKNSSITHLNAPHAKCISKDHDVDSSFWTYGINTEIKNLPRPFCFTGDALYGD